MTVKREYHENGQLRYERHYKGDLLNGLCRGWLNNGRLISELYYKNGLFHGRCRTWFSSGELRHEGYFRGNILIDIPEGVLPIEPCTHIYADTNTPQGALRAYSTQ